MLNRSSHGSEFLGWWRRQDKAPSPSAAERATARRDPSPIERLHREAYARAANRDLTYGGIWLLGGLLITGFSYGLAAINPHGGVYIIATGAILYGVLRLIRGLTSHP